MTMLKQIVSRTTKPGKMEGGRIIEFTLVCGHIEPRYGSNAPTDRATCYTCLRAHHIKHGVPVDDGSHPTTRPPGYPPF